MFIQKAFFFFPIITQTKNQRIKDQQTESLITDVECRKVFIFKLILMDFGDDDENREIQIVSLSDF